MSLARPQAAHESLGTWIGFAAMCVGMFMAILDVQIVATSLRTIQAALETPPDSVSWVQTAYLIAEVVSIPLTGPLTRILGLRRLVVTALLGFSIASAGCAASPDLQILLVWRLFQGFAGGVLIPTVFTAVFLLFRERRRPLATAMAGMLAVLAPTVGPLAGGFVTATWSWHWLFLINLPPGLIAVALTGTLVPRGKPDPAAAKDLDRGALVLMALSLVALILGLKEAPDAGWAATRTIVALIIASLAGVAFIRRTLTSAHPIVALRLLRHRDFAIGCLLSFVFGAGLFGSVYLMPVFLGYVRGHSPLEIGQIMLVTGIAQLATAPVAAALERRVDARWLTGAGFLLFATGLGLGAGQTVASDYDAMVWPQILRGIGIMFCLVPTTRFTLGRLPASAIPDASGLFNLMRNLGGAIGLAVIDTVLYGRAPTIGRSLTAGLRSGDPEAATRVGLSPALLARTHAPLDSQTLVMLQKMIGRAALTDAANEAWAMLALATLVVTVAILLAKPERRAISAASAAALRSEP